MSTTTKNADSGEDVEQLLLVMAEVQIATVRNQVLLSLFTDFENFSVFKPDSRHEKSVNEMFDQVIAWSGALKTLRAAVLFRPDFVARSSQIHCGICRPVRKHLAPRLAENSLAANVIVFIFMTT
jgi:hypothetical protein